MGLRQEHKLSERQACKIVSLRRSVYRYQPRPNRDQEVVKLLLELAQGRPEQGFGKLFKRLRRLGHKWNHKRVYACIAASNLTNEEKAKSVCRQDARRRWL